MKIKVKRLSERAVVPSYAQEGDAGMDLTAVSVRKDDNNNIVYGTGLAFEIPRGYVGLLFPRSSNAKTTMLLSNSVGVIDSGYRGEVTLKFKDFGEFFPRRYQVGDRIGQLIILPYPYIEFEEAEELSDTQRGTGGYGSTGS